MHYSIPTPSPPQLELEKLSRLRQHELHSTDSSEFLHVFTLHETDVRLRQRSTVPTPSWTTYPQRIEKHGRKVDQCYHSSRARHSRLSLIPKNSVNLTHAILHYSCVPMASAGLLRRLVEIAWHRPGSAPSAKNFSL